MTPCAGSMGHPFKKSLFDNDDSAFQTPFVRTDVLSSQYNRKYTSLEQLNPLSCAFFEWIFQVASAGW